ncbi:MAG: ribonuclease P protein component [Methylobacteriaceae bacterium]|nr:ribonuclease P protein component [Methylobacteriaceae bacterium]
MDRNSGDTYRGNPVGRLRKRTEFLAAASGRRYRSDIMTIQAISRSSDGMGLRLGLTVTKRVGNAVERNRIKRRLRAASALALPPHADRDTDMVIIARRPVLDIDFKELTGALAKAAAVILYSGRRLRD